MPIGKPDFSGLFFTVNGSGFLYSDFVNAVTRVLRVRSWQQLMSDVPPMTVAGRRGHGYRALSLLPSQQANRAKEIVVAVVAVFEAPNLSQEQYEESVRRLTSGGKSRMESPSDWLVPGLLVHVAAKVRTAFVSWTCGNRMKRFVALATIMPILKELGLDIQPDIYPSLALVSAIPVSGIRRRPAVQCRRSGQPRGLTWPSKLHIRVSATTSALASRRSRQYSPLVRTMRRR